MDRNDPIYVISVAAQLAQMHPQTLRQYDRMGLVVPNRRNGRHRRYSAADVERLRRIHQLSAEGISLEGVRRVIQMERETEELRRQVRDLHEQVARWRGRAQGLMTARVFSAGSTGEVSIKASEREARARTRLAWHPFELTSVLSSGSAEQRQSR